MQLCEIEIAYLSEECCNFAVEKIKDNDMEDAVVTEDKSRERLWNANYNKVMLNNFALFFSLYLLTPLLPLYLSETWD